MATEDVLYMLQGMGIETGIDMEKLLVATQLTTTILKREPTSRAANAMLAKRQQNTHTATSA